MTDSTPIERVAALTIAFGIVLSVFAPGVVGVAAAAGNTGTGVGNQPLSIGVHQGAGAVVVSVSHNGTAVENATVNVTADTAYNGTGAYPNGTDAAGILRIPEPEGNRTVNVTITAEKGNLSGETLVTLRGTNGTGPGFVPFGIRIAAFVDSLQASGGITGIGPYLSSYIHMDGPPGQADGGPAVGPPQQPQAAGNGNGQGPPAHAGPPEDRGPSSDGERGPPEHAGPPDDTGADDQGPPDHAGPPDDRDAENADDADDDGDEGNGGGPPDDRGHPNR